MISTHDNHSQFSLIKPLSDGPVNCRFEYVPFATLLQRKALSKNQVSFDNENDLFEILKALLAPGGISQFHRKNNKTNDVEMPIIVIADHQPRLSKSQALSAIANQMYKDVQWLEARCRSDASVSVNQIAQILGEICKGANAFAKEFVERIIDPEDTNKALITTKDTIAAGYVLIMLVAWMHAVQFTESGRALWSLVDAEVNKVLVNFKELKDCPEGFAKQYLTVLTAAVKHCKIESKNNILRALALFFRNQHITLGIGAQCSSFMSKVYVYHESLIVSMPKVRTSNKRNVVQAITDERAVEMENTSQKKRKAEIEMQQPHQPQTILSTVLIPSINTNAALPCNDADSFEDFVDACECVFEAQSEDEWMIFMMNAPLPKSKDELCHWLNHSVPFE